MIKPLLIFGSKGASKEAYYIIKDMNLKEKLYKVKGFIEGDGEEKGREVTDGQIVIGTDSDLKDILKGFKEVAIVIPFGEANLKRRIFDTVKEYVNVFFPNIIHPSAIISNIVLGKGNIIAPGAVLACDSGMGDFNLVNRCATLGHDVFIGDFNSICPGAVISGDVTIEDACIIGANSTILQGIKVKSETLVGAGAVVTKSTAGEETLVGVPAKRLKNGK